MIRYKCGKCGAMLESPNSMKGHRETCPSCGQACIVPEEIGAAVAKPAIHGEPTEQSPPLPPKPTSLCIAAGNQANQSRVVAIVAMILGIAAVFVPFLGVLAGIVAIILGIRVLKRKERGRRLAMAGLATGSVGILVQVVGIALGIVLHVGLNGSSSASDWDKPRRVRIMDRGGQVQTTFLVGLKDAWYTDYGRPGKQDGKKTFFVVYYYKNLGPRECNFSLAPSHSLFNGDKKVEIRTNKGRIFSGDEFRVGSLGTMFDFQAAKHDVGGWWPRTTSTVGETGESAVFFRVPRDETPIELMISGTVDLDTKLPRHRFEFRRHTKAFGFLPPKPEKVVPGLIDALQDKDTGIRTASLDTLGVIGPAAKDAVPAIVRVLLNDKWMDVRTEAAKALGKIGPAAREAIAALKQPLRVSRPRYGGAYVNDLRAACNNALAKIEKRPAISPPGKIPKE